MMKGWPAGWILAAFGVSSMVWCCLAWVSEVNAMLVLLALQWILFGLAAWRLRGIDAELSCGKIPLPNQAWIWAAFAVIRAPGFFSEPLFEDDPYRYLMDGYVFVSEGNPYDRPPLDYFDRELPEEIGRALDHVNYPHLPTVYGPTLQFTFAVVAWLAPGEMLVWKAVVLWFDAATFMVLLHTVGRKAWLYGFCPLVVFINSYQGHAEIAGVFFVTSALMVLGQNRKRDNFVAALAFGLALAAKPFAVFSCFYLALSAAGRRRFLALLVGGFSFGALLYSPFWLQGSWAGMDISREVASYWKFNPIFFPDYLLLGESMAKMLSLGVVLSLQCLVGWWVCRDTNGSAIGCRRFHRLATAGIGGALLLSPVVNPWYLLWLYPFVVRTDQSWPFVVMAASMSSYATGLAMGDFSGAVFAHDPMIRLSQIGMIVVAIIYDISKRDADRGGD